jgi:uncharacterized membrane protein YeiH
MTLFSLFEIFGTIVFAISGANVGAEKKMDIFGCSVLAFATAIGGGTIRDVMLGITPVSWTRDFYAIISILIGIFLAYILRGRILQKMTNIFFLFDTIGIALFTIVGIEKALSVAVQPFVALMMGIFTAVFGGVVRDVLANRIPLVLREEIYATACLAGGFVYILLKQISNSDNLNILLTSGIIFIIRFFAVKYHWSLPKF